MLVALAVMAVSRTVGADIPACSGTF